MPEEEISHAQNGSRKRTYQICIRVDKYGSDVVDVEAPKSDARARMTREKRIYSLARRMLQYSSTPE